jgi:uncharacterized protein YjiS (DUF1127 family)
MTIHPTGSTLSPVLAPTAGLFQRFVARRLARREKERAVQTYRQLLEGDDHTLCDLGVTRQDVLRLLTELEAR